MRATHPLTRRRVFGSSRGSNPQTHLEPLSHASYASRRTGCVGRRHWTRVFISTSMIPASGSAPRSEAIRHARPPPPCSAGGEEKGKKEGDERGTVGQWIFIEGSVYPTSYATPCRRRVLAPKGDPSKAPSPPPLHPRPHVFSTEELAKFQPPRSLVPSLVQYSLKCR